MEYLEDGRGILLGDLHAKGGTKQLSHVYRFEDHLVDGFLGTGRVEALLLAPVVLVDVMYKQAPEGQAANRRR